MECLESLLEITDRRRLQAARRSFAEPSSGHQDTDPARRVTLGNIGRWGIEILFWSIQIFPCRSETLAIPDTAAVSGSRPRLQPAGGRRPRRLSGGSFRAGARSGETSARSSVSGHYGGGAAEVKLYIIINIFVDIYIFTQVSIDLDSCSSPARERPSTLPELNSRPASRVMKSFSVDEVGREPVDTSSWPVLASSRLILLSESNFRLNWPRNLLSNFS